MWTCKCHWFCIIYTICWQASLLHVWLFWLHRFKCVWIAVNHKKWHQAFSQPALSCSHWIGFWQISYGIFHLILSTKFRQTLCLNAFIPYIYIIFSSWYEHKKCDMRISGPKSQGNVYSLSRPNCKAMMWRIFSVCCVRTWTATFKILFVFREIEKKFRNLKSKACAPEVCVVQMFCNLLSVFPLGPN